MNVSQTPIPKQDPVEKDPYFMAYSEPCSEFIGYRLDPCERCGFPYSKHRW